MNIVFVLFVVVSIIGCAKPPATPSVPPPSLRSECGVVMRKVMHMTEDGDGRPLQYVQVEDPPKCLHQGKPEELDEVEVLLSMAPKKKGVVEARTVRLYLFGPDCLPISVYEKQFALEVGPSPPLADKVVKTFTPKNKDAVLFVSVDWKELAGSDIVVKRKGRPVAYQFGWDDKDRKHMFWYALGGGQNHCLPQTGKK